MKRQNCSNINDDVVFEKILPWLPPKSLLKFRSVSKSWYSAISHPYFIAKHLSHFGNNNCFLSLLVAEEQYSVKLRHIPEQQNQNLPGGLLVVEDIWLPEDLAKASSSRYYRVRASCNGLFCYARRIIGVHDRIYLFNPSTRCTRTVVPFRFSTNQDKFAPNHTYGVGFDRCTNDYKVIMFANYIRFSFSSTPRPKKAALYSVKTNSWKRLNNVPEPRFDGFDDSIFLHGFIHWLSYNSSTYKDRTIVLFDVGNEVFGEMKLPAGNAPYDSRYLTEISICTGSLCFFVWNRDCCDMWIMKEYGVGESWTKQVVIEFELLDMRRPVEGVVSTQATVGGKIIFGLSDYVGGFLSKLALFDPQTSMSQYLNVRHSYRGLVSLVPTLELLDVIM